MKTLKLIFTVVLFLSTSFVFSQETQERSEKQSLEKVSSEKEKRSYYKNRAKEDAKFEQEFKGKKSEERKFWRSQKSYEKELEERDEIAYEAYMQGKKDAYKEHHNNCTGHCSHGHYYHSHASFYYYGSYRSERKPYRRSSGTTVRIGTPSIRLGIF